MSTTPGPSGRITPFASLVALHPADLLGRWHAEHARTSAPGLDFVASVPGGYSREHERDHQDLVDGIGLALRMLSES